MNSTPLLVDNTFAIKLDKYPRIHGRTNHIKTKYHEIQYHVKANTIHLRHCSTSDQLADMFTKVLGRENLERFRKMFGLTNNPSD